MLSYGIQIKPVQKQFSTLNNCPNMEVLLDVALFWGTGPPRPITHIFFVKPDTYDMSCSMCYTSFPSLAHYYCHWHSPTTTTGKG